MQREGSSLVRIRWSPVIVLEEADAHGLTAELIRALPGGKRAPLSAISLADPSVLDETLIELYLEIYRPLFPVGYFDLEAAARVRLVRQPALG